MNNLIIDEARLWLGTPYLHQASCRGVGADCLGLVRGIYRALYGREPQAPPPYAAYAIPHDGEILLEAAQQYLEAASVPAQVGQVMIFRMRRSLPARHLAIMSFEGRMIHAASGLQVCEVAFSAWWQRRLIAAFSFPPLSPVPIPEQEQA